MGVAAQIVEYVPGVAERRLCIDHPLRLCRGGEPGGERLGVGEWFKLAVEMQRTRVEGMAQLFEKQTPEQAREYPHGQEETGATGDPVLAVRGDAATRHHAVHVRMMLQVLPPGVQDRDEADLGTQVFPITGDLAHGLATRAKQALVE